MQGLGMNGHVLVIKHVVYKFYYAHLKKKNYLDFTIYIFEKD